MTIMETLDCRSCGRRHSFVRSRPDLDELRHRIDGDEPVSYDVDEPAEPVSVYDSSCDRCGREVFGTPLRRGPIGSTGSGLLCPPCFELAGGER